MHIQALISAYGILPGSSFKPWLLVINLASVPDGQLVNSPTAKTLNVSRNFIRSHVIISLFLTFFLMSTSMLTYSQRQKSILKITIRNIDSSGITWHSYNFYKNKITIYEKPFPVSTYKEHLHTVRKHDSRDLFKKVAELRLYFGCGKLCKTINFIFFNKKSFL